MGNNSKSQSGFTIIELLIVIVIVGILAMITIVGYGAWRTNAVTAALKSDLNANAALMESARTTSTTGYPSDIRAVTNFAESDDVDITGGGNVDGSTFCLDGVVTSNSTIKYYIDSSFFKNGAKAGTCALNSSIAVPAIPTFSTLAVTTTTSTTLTWTGGTGATSFTAQCASDSGFVTNRVSQTSTTSPVTVTGLTPGVIYCHIRATNANGSSTWSATKQVTTTTDTLAAPQNITFTKEPSSSGATLFWSQVVGATSYTYMYSTSAAWTGALTGTTSNLNSGVLTLSGSTLYYMRVKATAGSIDGAWSTSVSFTTNPVAP